MSIGVMLFNPFIGNPRHPDDIASDPRGVLIWDGEEPLKPHPPQRQWIGLTDEEIKILYSDDDNFQMTKKYVVAFARVIEAAHGIKAAK